MVKKETMQQFHASQKKQSGEAIKLVFTYTAIIYLVMSCWSCSDFLERNLEKETVTVLSPANNYVSSSINITFWWEEVKGASSYNLQIVKPSFASIQQVLLDTLTEGTKFQFSFKPGDNYQWRIRAENNSSHTQWFVYSFSVDSTLDLSNQVVQLLLPADNTISNKLTHLFKWSPIYFADDYRFEILSSSGNVMDVKGAVLSDTVSYAFNNEGTYKWRVQAHNDEGSVSPFSNAFTITIDTTSPETPLLTAPPNNSTVTLPYNFTWTRSLPGITDVRDSVLIFSDSLQSTLIKYAYTSKDSSSLWVDSLPQGIYYWKVKSIDAAGNKSPYSSSFKFSVP